jgi:hypothetical protein
MRNGFMHFTITGVDGVLGKDMVCRSDQSATGYFEQELYEFAS